MMKRLRDSIKRARQAIASGNLDLANAVGKEMCDIFEADYNISDEAEYTPEMAALQYECLTTLLDLHILRGEPIDISIRYAQILKKYRMDREHFKSWPEADWNDSRMHIEHAVMAVERFFNDSYHKRYESEVATNHPFGGKCALCREREADKTGSHMVPHMLIARTFSYDGSPHRDKVVVEVLIDKVVIHKDVVHQLHLHVVDGEVVQHHVVMEQCQDHALNTHHIMDKTVAHILKLQDVVF